MAENERPNPIIEFPSISICEKYPTIMIRNGSNVMKFRSSIGSTILLLKSGVLKKGGDNSTSGFIDFNRERRERKSGTSNVTIKTTFGPLDDQIIKCIFFRNDQKRCYPNIHTTSNVAQCRTYFNQIGSNGKVIKKVVREEQRHESQELNSFMATFYINFTERSHNNILPKGDLFIVVHESKAIPNDLSVIYASRRFLIKPNKNYDLSFHKKTIVRLPKPYKTDCHHYEEGLNSSNIYGLSRDLCVLKCKTQKLLSKYNCMRYTSQVIYEDNYTDSKICNSSVHLDVSDEGIYYFEYFSAIKCFQKCKTECIQQVFNFDLNEVDRSDGDLLNNFINATNMENVSLITLMSNTFDEISYIHLPKMRFTDFWSSLGGVFSLWLGLSVLTIYDSIIAFCVSLIEKF